jgi:hypothetical protein
MAKFSISVPDAEWEQARAVGGDLNASQLVQTALRQFVESRAAKPAFARCPPIDAADLIEAVSEELRAEARRSYEAGYHGGGRMAKGIGWSAIELLGICSWDFKTWMAVLKEDYELKFREYGDTYEYLSEELSSGPSGHPPGSVWQMGFVDALHDVWRTVVEERSPEGENRDEDAEADLD